MAAQPTPQMLATCKQRLTQLPGPQGGADNEAYMAGLVNKCDALAMFAGDGSLMWAWSQDKMNAWYWHVDVEQDDNMYSTQSYTYTQGDGSHVEITSETSIVAEFMSGKRNTLFFNGAKFHLTQKDKTEDGIIWAVMGGAMERGLHCCMSPGADFMVVAAASPKALPSERYMGIDTGRAPGSDKTDSRALGGAFRQFAPGALGI